MSSSKKIYLYRDFAAEFICQRPRIPRPHLTRCRRVYSILFTQGREGELNQREGYRDNSSQS